MAISSVSGMGGVGKTELAIQYAQKYYDNYSGGIAWFNVRDTNLANEIIQFIQLQMGLEIPQKDNQEMELKKQLLGENHPGTAMSLNNLAVLYDSQGKYEQAQPPILLG